MTSAQRKHIQNGIWMCYTHGKLIDTDETRFTIEMLTKWREFAEFRARFQQAFGMAETISDADLIEIGFAKAEVEIELLGQENAIIGGLIDSSCVSLVWGDAMSSSVRDLLVELTRNAFSHGNAKSCAIRIDSHALFFQDDGADFNWLDLNEGKRGSGGTLAIQHFLAEYQNKMVISSRRCGAFNKTCVALARTQSDFEFADPCCMQLESKHINDVKRGWLPVSHYGAEMKSCRIIYVLAPLYLAPSDATRMGDDPAMDFLKGHQLVFVTARISDLVKNILCSKFDGCRILVLPE